MLRDSIPTSVTDPLIKVREAMKHRQCTFRLGEVKEEDVLKVIQGLKNSSATGVDYIDTRTLKLAAKLIAPALTHLL